MKNLILASFLTLTFSQDLITTRAFEFPLSFLVDNSYSQEDWGDGAGEYHGILDLAEHTGIDFTKIVGGRIVNGSGTNHISISSCDCSISENTFEHWGFEIASSEDISYNLTYYSYIPDEAYLELWIMGNFGDEVGLIDNLQDQINDLEVQVEGLLAELLDCQGCNGDVNTDENIDILDVITVVQHILDTDTDGCIEN